MSVLKEKKIDFQKLFKKDYLLSYFNTIKQTLSDFRKTARLSLDVEQSDGIENVK